MIRTIQNILLGIIRPITGGNDQAAEKVLQIILGLISLIALVIALKSVVQIVNPSVGIQREHQTIAPEEYNEGTSPNPSTPPS